MMLTGDLLERLPDAVAAAPVGSTVVVFHTAVLVYLPAPAREAFVDLVGRLPVRWIAQEGLPVLPALRKALGPAEPATPAQLPLSLDGQPVALTAPHGGQVDWLPEGHRPR